MNKISLALDVGHEEFKPSTCQKIVPVGMKNLDKYLKERKARENNKKN